MSTSFRPLIVVVGSLHYDIMVDAPDRPRKGETVTGHAWRPKFGGKGGNQALAAARREASVRMAGAVGDDEFGRFLLERLAAGGVNRDHVATLPGSGSGMSVAISDAGGDYGAVIVSGANLSIDPHAVADADLWRDARALILQNEVPEAVNLAAARAAKAAGAIVCLNAAPVRALSSEFASLVDVLVVNAVEAEDMCGLAVDDLPSAVAAARRLSSCFETVVVTAGGAGVAGLERGAEPISLPALPVTLVSTHGAGDVFVGALIASMVKSGDASLLAHLQAANIAAAEHVSMALSRER
jgi:ribokinase